MATLALSSSPLSFSGSQYSRCHYDHTYPAQVNGVPMEPQTTNPRFGICSWSISWKEGAIQGSLEKNGIARNW